MKKTQSTDWESHVDHFVRWITAKLLAQYEQSNNNYRGLVHKFFCDFSPKSLAHKTSRDLSSPNLSAHVNSPYNLFNEKLFCGPSRNTEPSFVLFIGTHFTQYHYKFIVLNRRSTIQPSALTRSFLLLFSQNYMASDSISLHSPR